MDLKKFRTVTLRGKEGGLLTQSAFGDALGVTQEQVSRWEKNPQSVSVKIIHLICDTFGITPDILFDDFQSNAIDALDFGDPLDEFNRKQEMLEFYTTNGFKVLKGHEVNSPAGNKMLQILTSFKELKHLKPIVGVIGCYDSGKSHLINSICGSKILPTNWSPTTAIPVLLRHSNSRPDWLKDDVLILNPVTDIQAKMFKNFYPHDKSDIDHILVDSGDYKILETYGTYSSILAQEDKWAADAGFAIIYSNAPVLRTCDLLDFPGLSVNATKEETKFLNYINIANHFIFLSRATSFMNSTDILFLNKIISQVAKDIDLEEHESPLSRLVIVASQAHHLKDTSSVEMCLNNGAKLVWELIPATYKTKENDIIITLDQLRNRCVPFTSNDKTLQVEFEQVLSTTLLDHAIPYLSHWSSGIIKGYKENAYEVLTEEIMLFQSMKDDTELTRSEWDQRISNWSTNEKNMIDFRKELQAKAYQHSKDIVNTFSSWWKATVNKSFIMDLINRNNFNRKKSADFVGQSLSTEFINELRVIQNHEVDIYNKGYHLFLQNYGLDNDVIKMLSTADTIFLPGTSQLIEILKSGEANQQLQTWVDTVTSARWHSSEDQDLSPFTSVELTLEHPIGSASGDSWKEALADVVVQSLEKEQVLDQYVTIIAQSWEQIANMAELIEKEFLPEIRDSFKLYTDAATKLDDDELASIIADLTRMREIINNIVW
jgi:transcriptional regulator with XRE-family HTH domain